MCSGIYLDSGPRGHSQIATDLSLLAGTQRLCQGGRMPLELHELCPRQDAASDKLAFLNSHLTPAKSKFTVEPMLLTKAAWL